MVELLRTGCSKTKRPGNTIYPVDSEESQRTGL